MEARNRAKLTSPGITRYSAHRLAFPLRTRETWISPLLMGHPKTLITYGPYACSTFMDTKVSDIRAKRDRGLLQGLET